MGKRLWALIVACLASSIARAEYASVERILVDRTQAASLFEARFADAKIDPSCDGLLLEASATTTEAARLALFAGDCVREVNGFPVASVQKFRAELARVKDARHIYLELKRTGHEQMMDYQLATPREVALANATSMRDVLRTVWVTRVDATHYEIDFIVAMMWLATSGRSLPGNEPWPGLIDGFQVLVTPQHAEMILEPLGLRITDQLVSLNGNAITDKASFVNPFFEPAVDHFTLVIKRDGKPLTFEYTVRPGTRAHPGDPLMSDPQRLARLTRVSPDAPVPAIAEDLDRNVHCVGARCTIERAFVEKLLGNTSMIATSARFVPSMKDGQPNGFKLYAIRPSSIFGRLGFQNGDTLKQVNGIDMSTPDRALEAYTKLRTADHLTLNIERRGELVTLEIVIVR